MKIELVNTGDIFYGDEVTLEAVIENATMAYTIRWEYDDGGEDGWQEIANEHGTRYKFIVTEENIGFDYRVVLLPQA